MRTSLVRQRCEGCGSNPSHWYVDPYGQSFCEGCVGTERCFACSSPAQRWATPAIRLRDGRIRCGRCSFAAVDTQADVRRVVPAVRRFYEGLDIVTANRAQVVLVPSSAMVLPEGSALLGQTRLVRNRGRDTVRRIEIVGGLPQLLFERVLGHEIGHGFLAGCVPRPRTDDEVEGIAEMVSSWWLSHCDDSFARQLERGLWENPDPTYGGGYRMARSMTEGQPVAEIVRRLRLGHRLR